MAVIKIDGASVRFAVNDANNKLHVIQINKDGQRDLGAVIFA